MVSQLAIILIAAGVFTIISKALKQPLILGYIVAGFIVGPHLGLFPQFSPESVDSWSELGIVFLLFGLGLEFSFKKLLNTGSAAAISAGTIALGMMLVGLVTGKALGWTWMESLFLGGMMSMSSTTIIIKAYDDLGKKNEPYANLVFGLLVVEDLLAVLMMVLFSTIAVSNKFSGGEMLLSLVKLVSFLVLCFLVGIYVLPSLFKRTRKYLNDEILLLISIGLCFLMVMMANKAGFSSALGAFLMGSILSSTIEGEQIEKITVSIKNLFGAIFFVSVGMMVNPTVIAQYWPTILVLTVVAMLGILLFSTTGVLLAGKGLDTALHVGFSLPQLGEFSFIIAGLGASLGVISDHIYPIIISVSVITTFTTPYMIKAADPASAWLHRVLPERFVKLCNRRLDEPETVGKAEKGLWNEFLKKYLIRVGIYSLLLTVLLIGMKEYLPKLCDLLLPDLSEGWRRALMTVVALAVMSPFLYGLGVNSGSLKKLGSTLMRNSPKAKTPVIVSISVRMLMAVEFALVAISAFARIGGWEYALVFVTLVLIFILFRRGRKEFTSIEDRFFKNLQAKENQDRKQAPVTYAIGDKMSKSDIGTDRVTISSDFQYAGQTLREMPFRHSSGVNIVKIQRGRRSILIPSGDERIFPGDILVAVGTKAQLDKFSALVKDCSACVEGDDYPSDDNFSMEEVLIAPGSFLDGKLLKDTSMREAGCMVISVVRDGEEIINPDKEFLFHSGDSVWMAGLQESIDFYKGIRRE